MYKSFRFKEEIAAKPNVDQTRMAFFQWCCVHDIQSYPTSKDDDIYLDDRLNQAQARSASSIPTIRPPVVASVSQSTTGFARLAAFFQVTFNFKEFTSSIVSYVFDKWRLPIITIHAQTEPK